jgi:hypothetical protein
MAEIIQNRNDGVPDRSQDVSTKELPQFYSHLFKLDSFRKFITPEFENLQTWIKENAKNKEVDVSPTGYQKHSDDTRTVFTEITITNADTALYKQLQKNSDALGDLLRQANFSGSPKIRHNAIDRSIVIYNAQSSKKSMPTLPGEQNDIAANKQVLPKAQRRFPNAELPPKPKAIDFCIHHNQALDAIDKAQNEGLIEKGATLVHVDTHSDIQLNKSFSGAIAGYVNRLPADGSVNEIYWVVPDNLPIRKNQSNDPFVGSYSGALALNSKPPYSTTLFVAKDGLASTTRDDFTKDEKIRSIPLHICRARDLPDFAKKSNIILDIDADYFSNSGHDTASSYTHNPSTSELARDLESFGRYLRKSNLTPKLTILAKSPAYLPDEDYETIAKYFSHNGTLPDYLSTKEYLHGRPQEEHAFMKDLSRALSGNSEVPFDRNANRILRQLGYIELANLHEAVAAGKAERAALCDALEKQMKQLDALMEYAASILQKS